VEDKRATGGMVERLITHQKTAACFAGDHRGRQRAYATTRRMHAHSAQLFFISAWWRDDARSGALRSKTGRTASRDMNNVRKCQGGDPPGGRTERARCLLCAALLLLLFRRHGWRLAFLAGGYEGAAWGDRQAGRPLAPSPACSPAAATNAPRAAATPRAAPGIVLPLLAPSFRQHPLPGAFRRICSILPRHLHDKNSHST